MHMTESTLGSMVDGGAYLEIGEIGGGGAREAEWMDIELWMEGLFQSPTDGKVWYYQMMGDRAIPNF